MKLRLIICMALAVVLLTLAGCSKNESPKTEPNTSNELESVSNTEPQTNQKNETEKTPESEKSPMKKSSYSILFIGNSYTYYSDMPTSIFRTLAKNAGYNVKVTAITNGGHTLEKMADTTDTYGLLVEKALTGNQKYDYVILQEQSARPATDSVGSFYKAVRNLAARIRESGAEPILYSTWGRKTGNSTLDKNGWTNESMTWKLAAAYDAIGKELNIHVAHVGLAFYDIYTGNSGINIYDSDKSHPSYAGSYLAASTLFAKIFNEDPTDINYKGSLTEENAATLRNAASKAVFQTPDIPNTYKTTSEGIGN